jgi:nucleoid-associated protein YgaU
VTSASGTEPPATTVVRDGRTGDLASLPAASTPPAPDPPPAPAPAPPPAGAPAAGGDTVVVVAPGDNLWELAARRLAAAGGRPRASVDAAAIAPYWATVCDRNRPTLASGDASLIYPGEVVVLPPVS